MNTILLNSSCSSFAPLCPFGISWLWYAVSVVLAFVSGWAWYNFFTERWVKAVNYGLCACGADLSKGEKCTCKPDAKAFLPMIAQLLATCFIGYMYFVLVQICVGVAIIAAVAIIGWMKANILFSTPGKQRRIDRILIDVGYFTVVSVIFILFALI
jgi:hypothetical protein